jgi:hypothetical protein|eukprot:COSAG06_NODE_568_length_14183_cov_130.573843_9_plen_64_part_00
MERCGFPNANVILIQRKSFEPLLCDQIFCRRILRSRCCCMEVSCQCIMQVPSDLPRLKKSSHV